MLQLGIARFLSPTGCTRQTGEFVECAGQFDQRNDWLAVVV